MVSRSGWWFLLLLLSFPEVSARPSTDGDEVVARVYFEDITRFEESGTPLETWSIHPERGFLVARLDAGTVDALTSEGFTVIVDPGLTERLIAPTDREPKGAIQGIPGYPCYETVEETFAAMDAMAATRPEIARVVDAGDSWEKENGLGGYDLRVLVLTNQTLPGPKPALFVMSSVHAREYTPAALSLAFARRLFTGYGIDAEATRLLDTREIHLMIQANPDGRKRAEAGILWRKNANNDHCPDSNSTGVDLNRNFPFAWAYNGFCSSVSECSGTYRGSGPASEPETTAIESYVQSIFPDQRGEQIDDPAPADATGIFIDIHSYGGYVLWPYGFDAIPAPNDVALQTLGRKLAFFNGYSPEKASMSFTTCGTTDDFGYGTQGLAAYTFEIGFSFFENCSVYESLVLEDNLEALFYAARVADAPYLLPAGPDTTAIDLNTNTVNAGEPVTVTAEIRGDRYNNSNGTEPTRTVAAAEIFVDTGPEQNGTPIAMSPLDGAFDQLTEQAGRLLDTTGLEPGRHTILVRGVDVDGNAGPLSTRFLTVLTANETVTLQGSVRGLGSGPLSGADVSSGSVQTTTGPDGSFTLELEPGPHSVEVSASGHMTRTVFDITLVEDPGPGENQIEVLMFPTCDQPLALQAVSGDWVRLRTPTGYIWDDSPGAYYPGDRDALLISAPIRLPHRTQLALTQAFEIDTPGGDLAEVLLWVEDGSPVTLAGHTGTREVHDRSIDLDAWSTQTVRLGFRLTSDARFDADGWQIMNAALSGSFADCVGEILRDEWPEGSSVRDFIDYQQTCLIDR